MRAMRTKSERMRISLTLMLHMIDFDRKARKAVKEWLKLATKKNSGVEIGAFYNHYDNEFVVGYLN